MRTERSLSLPTPPAKTTELPEARKRGNSHVQPSREALANWQSCTPTMLCERTAQHPQCQAGHLAEIRALFDIAAQFNHEGCIAVRTSLLNKMIDLYAGLLGHAAVEEAWIEVDAQLKI